ncbi:hypothetical protein FACS189487_08400 [Campylobacterota bacterium]|nr:hypothetical protein FACS189487_08400 [Campylobacterota bacterium]
MDFETIKLEHQGVLDRARSQGEQTTADAGFVNLWLWRFARKIEIASLGDEGGAVFVKQTLPSGEIFFLAPIGGEMAKNLAGLKDYARKADIALNFRAVTEEQKQAISAACPDEFSFTHDRDHSDYLYKVSDMISLAGRPYHSKKNFINRYETFYGINYERLNAKNFYEAISFIDRWFQRAEYAAEAEKLGILSLIENFDRFKLSCGLLRAEDQIAALTVGEKLSDDRVVIHIEKADGANFSGSYQTINQVHLAQEYADFSIVNREEDLGLEGLRKAKLSYHPFALADKYRAFCTN